MRQEIREYTSFACADRWWFALFLSLVKPLISQSDPPPAAIGMIIIQPAPTWRPCHIQPCIFGCCHYYELMHVYLCFVYCCVLPPFLFSVFMFVCPPLPASLVCSPWWLSNLLHLCLINSSPTSPVYSCHFHSFLFCLSSLSESLCLSGLVFLHVFFWLCLTTCRCAIF